MATNLKPANLITTNKVVSVQKITSDLNKNIPENSEDPITTYLKLLVEMYSSPSKNTEKQIKDHYGKNRQKINAEMSSIKNDFGEILGGIATVNQNLLNKFYSKINFTGGNLEYPIAQNEPLKDYSVFVGDKEFIISAKISGATSNTVKPQDIMKLIDKSFTMSAQSKKDLQNTLEYKVLDILGTENTLKGPVKAIAYICTHLKDNKKKMALRTIIDVVSFPNLGSAEGELSKINQNVNTSKKTSNPYKGKTFAGILKSKQFAAYAASRSVGDPPTWADIVLFCEQAIEKMTKTKILDFGELFLDAITSQVHYVKLSVDTSTGIPKFEAYASVKLDKGKKISNFDAGSIYMRSKSSMYKDGRYRLKDKMGIQT